jgi:transcriptional regulator with XRE-family HTH domain
MATDEKPTGRPLGATGEVVRINIRRIRDYQGISGPELSARLKALDRQIPPLGIHRIENGSRRVDVDDLVALAVALGVSPVTLLTPNSDYVDDLVTATGLSDTVTAEDLWAWMRADRPLKKPTDGMAQLRFLELAAPAWRTRQYGEGVLQLLELNRLEADVKAGGEKAAEARRRLDEIQAALDGDD